MDMINENRLNELDSMTETDRRITLGSPEWKELVATARQGLRLQPTAEALRIKSEGDGPVFKKLFGHARKTPEYWTEACVILEEELAIATKQLSTLQTELSELRRDREKLEEWLYRITLKLQAHRTLTDYQKDGLFQECYRLYVLHNADRFDPQHKNKVAAIDDAAKRNENHDC